LLPSLPRSYAMLHLVLHRHKNHTRHLDKRCAKHFVVYTWQHSSATLSKAHTKQEVSVPKSLNARQATQVARRPKKENALEPSATRHLHDRKHSFRRGGLKRSGLDWARRRAHPVTQSIFGLAIERGARWPTHWQDEARARR
jgi:hypothetical protein